LLSILCGHTRYAHVNALRFDTVTPPPMLGMGKVVSEDSARRAFAERQFGRFRCTPNFAHFCKQSLPAGLQIMKLRLDFFDAVGRGFHCSHFHAVSNYGNAMA
jgi:hypothetical protein